MFHVEHGPAGGARSAPGEAGRRAVAGEGLDARSAGCHAGRGGAVPLAAPRSARISASPSGRRHVDRGRAAGILLVGVLLLSPGCAGIRSARLYFPEASGLASVRPGVYVDPELTAPQREAFAADLEAGRRRAAEFYGGLVSSPRVVACASMACYRRFGGIGGKGVSRNGAILFSPKGLTPAIVSHEWSHAELAARIGQLRTWWSVPQWFDDGIAVLLSGDPDYTEEAWRAATDNGAKAPPLSDLETLRGWLRATGKDGKTKQFSYGTARHTVAGWYAVAGREGFRALIEGVRNGEDFRKLYARTGTPAPGRDVPRGTSSPAAGAAGPKATAADARTEPVVQGADDGRERPGERRGR